MVLIYCFSQMDNPLLRPSSRRISRSGGSGNFAIFASLFVIVSVLVLIPVLVVVLHNPTESITTTTTAAATTTFPTSTTITTTATTTLTTTTTAATTTTPSIISLVDGVSNRVDYDSIDDSFVFAEYEAVGPSDVQLRVKKKSAATNNLIWSISQACLAVEPTYGYNFVTIEPVTSNIYVATRCTNGTFIYKYTPAGSLIWEQNYGTERFESQYNGARLEFDSTNSFFYVQQQQTVNVVLLQINATSGIPTGISATVNGACSSLPNYTTGGSTVNLKFAQGKIITGEQVQINNSDYRLCIQTYNATTLALESVYVDNLANASVLKNYAISIDVDKANGDVYAFIYQSTDAGWASTTTYLKLLKYDSLNTLVYSSTFLNATFQLSDPNTGLPGPRSIIAPTNGVLYFLSQYVTSPGASTGFRMLLSVNTTNGNQIALRSVVLSDMALVATSPMWRAIDSTIYYLTELDTSLSNFPG